MLQSCFLQFNKHRELLSARESVHQSATLYCPCAPKCRCGVSQIDASAHRAVGVALFRGLAHSKECLAFRIHHLHEWSVGGGVDAIECAVWVSAILLAVYRDGASLIGAHSNIQITLLSFPTEVMVLEYPPQFISNRWRNVPLLGCLRSDGLSGSRPRLAAMNTLRIIDYLSLLCLWCCSTARGSYDAVCRRTDPPPISMLTAEGFGFFRAVMHHDGFAFSHILLILPEP